MGDAWLKEFLEEKYRLFASPKFIESDPIQVPHLYADPFDIEIAAFLTATLAWGQRSMIIRFSKNLMELMGNSPHDYIMEFDEKKRKHVEDFQYRTFTGVDCIAFMQSLQWIYREADGLRGLFTRGFEENENIKGTISYFRSHLIAHHFPNRTRKHVSNPMAGSAAKRLNMFLRWMVRPANEKVDFGLWPEIPAAALMLPLDLHTGRVARKLGLLNHPRNNWLSVEEVTANLRAFDPSDPVKYDFALFGLGVFGKF